MRDDAIDVRMRDFAPRFEDPSRRIDDAPRILPHARSDSWPSERAARPRRDDAYVMAFTLEPPRFRPNEVPGGVVVVRRIAGRDDGDAHCVTRRHSRRVCRMVIPTV